MSMLTAQGNLTTKLDVYAYGIVLMEIITGREATDESLPEEEKYLSPVFRRNAMDQGGLRKIMDPTLVLTTADWKVLLELADLARHCTAPDADQRPVMHHCVNVISSVVDRWKPLMVDNNEGEISGMDPAAVGVDGMGKISSMSRKMEKTISQYVKIILVLDY